MNISGDIPFTHANNVLMEWGQLFYETYKSKLREAGLSGDLHDSMTFGVTFEKEKWSVYLNLNSYWKWIEYGRPPGGFPPVDSMISYIEAKPVIPRPHTLPTGRQVIPTVNQLAFLIGRKIKEKGIAPKRLMSETMTELRSGLITDLKKAFAKDISKVIMQSFEL